MRIVGLVGGPAAFATCAELDILAPAIPTPEPGFDLDADGEIGVDDMYSWHRTPVDLDGDGAADGADLHYLTAAVRWRELDDMRLGGGRP